MKGINNHYKKILKRKWPDPWYIRIDHRTPSRKGIRIRYRVYANRDMDDHVIYIAIFSERGTLISNEFINKKSWSPDKNHYRSQPTQYRR